MGAIGGSVESVEVAGRTFPVAADADGTRDLGGFTNENQPNGDGSSRKIMTRKNWKLNGLSLEIDDDRNDQEYLQSKANEKGYFPLTFTFVSNAVYQGVGTIEGDLQASSQSATAPLNFGGPGQLTQQ